MGEVLHGREMEVEHREEEDNKDKEEEEEEDNEGGAVLHGREMEVLTSIAWKKYCMGGVLHGRSIAWEKYCMGGRWKCAYFSAQSSPPSLLPSAAARLKFSENSATLQN